MFDDQQANQQQNTNNDGTGGISAPTLGGGMVAASAQPATAPSVIMPSPPSSTGATPEPPIDNDLAELKRRALEQLSPLVNKLDQTPEEKYKILMMMIQASDNHELINEAYDCAQKITDEKLKAEALLSIVNEINYFTQKSQD